MKILLIFPDVDETLIVELMWASVWGDLSAAVKDESCPLSQTGGALTRVISNSVGSKTHFFKKFMKSQHFYKELVSSSNKENFDSELKLLLFI